MVSPPDDCCKYPNASNINKNEALRATGKTPGSLFVAGIVNLTLPPIQDTAGCRTDRTYRSHAPIGRSGGRGPRTLGSFESPAGGFVVGTHDADTSILRGVYRCSRTFIRPYPGSLPLVGRHVIRSVFYRLETGEAVLACEVGAFRDFLVRLQRGVSTGTGRRVAIF
jgi:hypothetical protein